MKVDVILSLRYIIVVGCLKRYTLIKLKNWIFFRTIKMIYSNLKHGY